MYEYQEFDKYEDYAFHYDPVYGESQKSRRKLKKKSGPSQTEVVDQLTDGGAASLEGGFETTYVPARFETEWLLSSLRTFYDQALITDVLAKVKGGKEASVYLCAADPSTGVDYLAAKVYRPRKFRNLRNDKRYREGRAILATNGRPAKERDKRMFRALAKGTAFGSQIAHTSWLMYEYTTLEKLHAAGGAVPKPYGAGENAILMGYCGDRYQAAPTLQEVQLPAEIAAPLLTEVLRNVELMLDHGLIHGDLSAFNILCWDDEVTLIDFPQVVNVVGNSQATPILARDLTRVCEYFSGMGVACDADAIMAKLWDRYLAQDPYDLAADLSRLDEEEEE